MKTIDYISDHCPDYALSYLVNGDASGMEDSDITACDEWHDAARAKLQASYPDATVFLEFNFDDRNEFNRNPAFGLACATVPCAFVALVSNEDPRPSMRLPWELPQTPEIHVSDISAQEYIGVFETEGEEPAEWHAVKVSHPSGVFLVVGSACNTGLLPSYAREMFPEHETTDEALQELIADIEALPHPSGELLEWHGSMVI